jgi:hypothetical protein
VAPDGALFDRPLLLDASVCIVLSIGAVATGCERLIYRYRRDTGVRQRSSANAVSSFCCHSNRAGVVVYMYIMLLIPGQAATVINLF